MNNAGHAAHFLRRIDRLNAEQAELALGLYRDHELVKHLLQLEARFAGEQRVAVSLDDEQDGPFVVVSPDGKFVTCLGRGMRVAGAHVIPRSSLDHMSERVEGLREIMAKAKSGERHQSDNLIRRIVHAGPQLTREEFNDLCSWSPVLGNVYIDALARSAEALFGLRHALLLPKRLGRKNEALLKQYWRNAWAMMHFATLIAVEPKHLNLLVEMHQHEPGCVPLPAHGPAHLLAFTNMFSCWVRAVWAAVKTRSFSFSAHQKEFLDTEDPDLMTLHGLILVGMAVAEASYESEVSRTLDEFKGIREEQDFPASLVPFLSAALSFGRKARDTQLLTAHASDSWALTISKQNDPRVREHLERLSTEAQVGVMLSYTWPAENGVQMAERLIYWLPELVRFSGEEFYVPRSEANVVNRRWSLETGLRTVQPLLKAEDEYKPRPSVAPRTPGRNEPCSCGSGKKYKRCCGN